MMTHEDLCRFMTGQTLQAFDPDTGYWAATVCYRADGTLTARFADGQTDVGTWGVEGDHYWTRYDRFRGGARNLFCLTQIGPGRVQAHFADGRRAFVQASDREGQMRFDDLRTTALPGLRAAIRAGHYQGHTAGLAAGYLQVNLAILPASHALDFFRFCQRNPRPCPLVGVTDTGSRLLHTLGPDLRADTDAPAYAVYRDGAFDGVQPDVAWLWQDDFVAFALGCSFTFEHAAMEAGIEMRHVCCNRTVPMFRTTIPTVPAGPFGGGMVVSMRPIPPEKLEKVQQISAGFPLAHGAPVHIGNPEAIGIPDLQNPDYGEAVPINDGEIPVFWACGVTPQNAALQARLPIFVSHRPGAMLVTDVDERANPPVLDLT